MHTIEWNTVNCGFGLAERREQLPGARLPCRAQRRPVDQTEDFRERAMLVRLPFVAVSVSVTAIRIVHVPAGPFVTVMTLCALMLNDELSAGVRSSLSPPTERRRGHACAGRALGPDRVGSDGEPAESLTHLRERHAGV